MKACSIAAGAFVGAATAYGTAALVAITNSTSVEDFNEQGNWGTVTGTALGAVTGGLYGYDMARATGLQASPITEKNQSKTIKNDILGLPKTGSALKTDAYHAFPDIVDNYAGYATKSNINNATLYQIEGSLNGISGRFEWIVQNQMVTHRMFVPGGTINGIPIMP